MGHQIDLKKYQIRTDLALESINIHKSKSKQKIENFDKVKVTSIFVDKEISLQIDKKVGHYITIEFDDITDYENKEKVKKIFSDQLKIMLDKYSINEQSLGLVIGLGNEKSTPDSLGPLTVSKIVVTNHLYLLDSLEKGFRRICALSPGVMGQTGIETSDLILGMVNTIKPDFILTIDALASGSIDRVNRTIQMTDAGISPGSGVGNHRKEISKEILGIPVIAIGVPTVVDAATIVSDTFNYMHKHFSYTKKNINNPLNKIIPASKINYLREDNIVDETDKKNLLGIIGKLNDSDLKQLIFEVLTPIGYNLMVTPKEVDFVMEKLSDVIGHGINKAIHENITNL